MHDTIGQPSTRAPGGPSPLVQPQRPTTTQASSDHNHDDLAMAAAGEQQHQNGSRSAAAARSPLVVADEGLRLQRSEGRACGFSIVYQLPVEGTIPYVDDSFLRYVGSVSRIVPRPGPLPMEPQGHPGTDAAFTPSSQ